jgi:hypothetical protein
MFLFSTVSRPILKIPCLLSNQSQGAKRPRREADHTPKSIDEVKNGGRIFLFPHTSS